ncbi:MAG: glycoside hydrolase family 57 protein, partial [Bacteroidales bacterium]|nr:glycoside hydrolase family 57 protein [Bacteroidales bacterium]
MKQICLYFQVHQPMRLRKYRFFDMGVNHNYYDDYLNQTILRRVADKCYLPMNALLMETIAEYGDKIKICMSITGLAIEQFKWFAPEVLESFKKLIKTGNVELVSETYDFSLAALSDKELFMTQVKQQHKLLKDTFGIAPKSFRNTEFIYSDDMADAIYDLGYNVALVEGAKHVLGWKSSEYLYCSSKNPRLKLLLRNSSLSDDIAFRFGNTAWDQFPLTAEKYMSWIMKAYDKGESLTLGLEYETFGEHTPASMGIFPFVKDLLCRIAENKELEMNVPSKLAEILVPVGQLVVPNPTSWADEEQDITAWLGNELQQDAFKHLYAVSAKMRRCKDPELKKDYLYLQSADHFMYMC